MSEPAPTDEPRKERLLLPLALFVATCASTLYVGALMEGAEVRSVLDLWHGWPFALPLMAILLAHEMGHYVAGRIHGVDVSLPVSSSELIKTIGRTDGVRSSASSASRAKIICANPAFMS